MSEDFDAFLRSEDGGRCVIIKLIGDGIYAAVKPLLFHWTMVVGQVGDRQSYTDQWCYDTRLNAELALLDWSGDGDPAGWHRHPRTGRRRPGGDAAAEYVAW